MRRLLRHRDARLYIAGQALSTAGDSALWLAMGIWVKMLTGSNSAAGLVFFAYMAGFCLAPVTGLLADRLPRRRLLIAANLVTGAMVAALLAAGSGRLWLIYLVMVGYGAADSLISSGQTALLAMLLPGDLLSEANSALQLARQGLRVITPLAGAGILALAGPRPVILLDVATFGVAAALLALLRYRDPPRALAAPAPPCSAARAQITAGFRHIARTAALRRLSVALVIGASVFGFFETVEFAVVGQGLHKSAPFLGVLTVMQGIGAVAGGLLAPWVMRRTSEQIVAIGGLLAGSAACCLETTGELAIVLPGAALLGTGIVWINVGAITLVQRRTPAGLVGRVDAAANLAVTVPQALSIAAGAAIITLTGYRALLAVMAAGLLLAAVYLRRGRRDRRPGAPAVEKAAARQSSA